MYVAMARLMSRPASISVQRYCPSGFSSKNTYPRSALYRRSAVPQTNPSRSIIAYSSKHRPHLKDDTERKVLLRGVVVVAQKGLGVAPDGVAERAPNVFTFPQRRT